jgi:hypothetical protein
VDLGVVAHQQHQQAVQVEQELQVKVALVVMALQTD